MSVFRTTGLLVLFVLLSMCAAAPAFCSANEEAIVGHLFGIGASPKSALSGSPDVRNTISGMPQNRINTDAVPGFSQQQSRNQPYYPPPYPQQPYPQQPYPQQPYPQQPYPQQPYPQQPYQQQDLAQLQGLWVAQLSNGQALEIFFQGTQYTLMQHGQLVETGSFTIEDSMLSAMPTTGQRYMIYITMTPDGRSFTLVNKDGSILRYVRRY